MNKGDFEISDFELDYDPFVPQDNTEEPVDNNPEEDIIDTPTEDIQEPNLPENFEENWVQYGIDNQYLMIGDEDIPNISSIEDAFKIDAARRTELIQKALVDSFPDDFKVIAHAVLEKGINNPRQLLEILANNSGQEAEQEFNEAMAHEVIKTHHAALGYEDIEIDMVVEELKSRDKLMSVAQKIYDREQEANKKLKSVELEKEIARQAAEREEQERVQRENARILNEQFEEKSWRKDTKEKIKKEYLYGTTFKKIEQLALNPTTAPEFAMLVSRIFEQDSKGNIRLNMSSLTDLAASKEAKKIKESWSNTIKTNTRVKFGGPSKANVNNTLTEDYDFNF